MHKIVKTFIYSILSLFIPIIVFAAPPVDTTPDSYTITVVAGSSIPYVGPQTAGTQYTVYLNAEYSENGSKVVICHKPNSPSEKTMKVPSAALSGHLNHGDYLGPCGGYSGDKSLNFWSTYSNPNSGTKEIYINDTAIGTTKAAATNLLVTFANNSASIQMQYRDVGKVVLHVKDDADDTINGASGDITVKPGIMQISLVSGNPGAVNENDTVYKKAGEAFMVQVDVQDVDGNATPNYNKETPMQGIIITPSLIQPVGGVEGTIINNSSFTRIGSLTTEAKFECRACAFDEVGIIKLQAGVLGGDYFGAGDAASRPQTTQIGRFIPDHFLVNTNVAGQFNSGSVAGGFTYLEQNIYFGISPQVLVTAKAGGAATNTTQNYTGNFWKLQISDLSHAYAAGSYIGSSTMVGPPALDSSAAETTAAVSFTDHANGTGTYTFSDGGGLFFSKDYISGIKYKAFDAELQLAMTVQDSDSVAYGANPYTVGATTFGNGIAFNSGKKIYHGEVYLGSALMSKNKNLSVPFKIKYVDGSGNFIVNTNDSSTVFNNITNISLLAESTILAVGSDYNITGVITANGFVNGNGNLLLLSPNAKGYVDVEALLGSSFANLLHLKTWDYATSSYINPKVRVNFGINPGNNNIINFSEKF